jgi:ABC-type nitrate/sulfonate/bicarbonate transport system substrate-binding protein
VEAVVPQSALNAQTLLGTEAASAAAPAASTAKLLRGPFDPKSAGAALSKAAARAGICVPPGDAGGEAVVTITLDPSGVTSSAAVYGARFSGTQAGECIAGLLRDVKVRPFTGDPVTVKKTIQVN